MVYVVSHPCVIVIGVGKATKKLSEFLDCVKVSFLSDILFVQN